MGRDEWMAGWVCRDEKVGRIERVNRIERMC